MMTPAPPVYPPEGTEESESLPCDLSGSGGPAELADARRTERMGVPRDDNGVEDDLLLAPLCFGAPARAFSQFPVRRYTTSWRESNSISSARLFRVMSCSAAAVMALPILPMSSLNMTEMASARRAEAQQSLRRETSESKRAGALRTVSRRERRERTASHSSLRSHSSRRD